MTIQKNAIKTLEKKERCQIEEVKIQTNWFVRLLGITLELKLNIDKLLQYPLTPLTLCHLDGSMNNTDYSKLIKRNRFCY